MQPLQSSMYASFCCFNALINKNWSIPWFIWKILNSINQKIFMNPLNLLGYEKTLELGCSRLVPDYSVGFYYFADCFFVEIQTIRLRQLLLMILLADTMKVFSWLNWFIFISLSIRGLRRSEGSPNRQANTCETKCFSTR